MKLFLSFALVALVALASGQESTEAPTQPPTDPPATTQATTTANPGLPFGSLCNGLVARCNRYSDTVACVQRRNATATPPPSTEAPVDPTSENPVTSLFQRQNAEPDICETGITVDLGRCQCRRNCKEGLYVEDGEFDPEREVCVGLAGSTCSLLVPNCTKNATCNFLTSKCACSRGFVEDETRRCVPA